MGLFGLKTNAGMNALGGQEEEDIDVHSAHASIKRREKNSPRIKMDLFSVLIICILEQAKSETGTY